MRIINIEQGSDEWKAFRRGKIGASDIATLMTGTQKEICDLFWEKKEMQEKFVTQAMRRGSDMEAEARKYFEKKHGLKFERPVGLHDQHEWLMASFDGLNFDLGISLEIKCPNEVPDQVEDYKGYQKAFWQKQTQFAVGGHSQGFILIYSEGKQREAIIKRDEVAITNLIEKGKWFYGLLESNTPPPEPVQMRDDAQAVEFAEAAKLLKEQMDDLDEQWKILREGGIYLAGDVSFECNGVKVVKICPKPSVDYRAALDELAPNADLTRFLKPAKPQWRVTA